MSKLAHLQVPITESSLIAEAERFGHVEVGYTTFHEKREVCIAMGKWGNAQARVWGRGTTIKDACIKAIEKARVIAKWFPHPDSC